LRDGSVVNESHKDAGFLGGSVVKAGVSLSSLGSGFGKGLKLGAAAKTVSKAIPKGFKETKKFGYQYKQKVYEYKGKYYSKDVGSGNGMGSHNGGVWKVFEQHNGKLKRIGTADKNLKIFKD